MDILDDGIKVLLPKVSLFPSCRTPTTTTASSTKASFPLNHPASFDLSRGYVHGMFVCTPARCIIGKEQKYYTESFRTIFLVRFELFFIVTSSLVVKREGKKMYGFADSSS